VRASLVTFLVAALALLPAAAARASGAEPTPPKHASEGVKDVYADYNADSRVAECDHTQDDLQQTRDTMTPATADDFPDFVDQVRVALHHHEQHRCANDESASSAPEATSAPPSDNGSAPAPVAPESGQLPESEGGAPESGAIPPDQAATPVPSVAPTTAPPAATAPPVATPLASATPAIAHEGHRSLTIPAIILALAALGAAVLALSAFAGRRSPRVRHAWREAAFRTRGTWADFSDWLRLGR
jgi:hypothetical protein